MKPPQNPIEVYENVSRSQLSIARFYGGATVNGSRYVYDPATDSLTREDVVKRRANAARQARKQQQGGLL